jgi:FkbM family methyltransferase
MNRYAFRDFFRRRRVAGHVARHGPVFSYHGLEIRLPATSAVPAANSLIRGKYERDEAAMILKHLPVDMPVIELGGSLGVISRLVRSRIGPAVPHIVVEANADLIDICTTNAVAEAEPGTTTVVNAAVYYDGPVARFHIGDNAHSGALAANGDGGQAVEVPATTLAALADMLPPGQDYALVSDIEGAEYAVFERERDALSRVSMAILEIHPKAYRSEGKSEEGFLDLVRSAGFTIVDKQADVLVLVRR